MSTLFNRGIDSQLDLAHYFTLDFSRILLCYLCVLHCETGCLVCFLPNLVHLADLGAHIHLHSYSMGFFDLVLGNHMIKMDEYSLTCGL